MLVTLSSVALFPILLSSLGCAPPQDEDHRQLAHDHVKQGKIEAAIQQLEKIDQATPDDFNLRGELLMQLGRTQYENAGSAFHAALNIDDRNIRALYGLSLLAMFQKKFERAEELLRKVLELQPNSLHPQNLLAGALIYRGKYEAAEDLLLTLEKEPTMAGMAKGNLGELYLRQKKLDLAEAKLKEAISYPPDNYDRHRLLGEVYRLQGRKTAALTEYKKALDLLQRSRWKDPAVMDEIHKRIRELES